MKSSETSWWNNIRTMSYTQVYLHNATRCDDQHWHLLVNSASLTKILLPDYCKVNWAFVPLLHLPPSWSHSLPHRASPASAADFLSEAVPVESKKKSQMQTLINTAVNTDHFPSIVVPAADFYHWPALCTCGAGAVYAETHRCEVWLELNDPAQIWQCRLWLAHS